MVASTPTLSILDNDNTREQETSLSPTCISGFQVAVSPINTTDVAVSPVEEESQWLDTSKEQKNRKSLSVRKKPASILSNATSRSRLVRKSPSKVSISSVTSSTSHHYRKPPPHSSHSSLSVYKSNHKNNHRSNGAKATTLNAHETVDSTTKRKLRLWFKRLFLGKKNASVKMMKSTPEPCSSSHTPKPRPTTSSRTEKVTFAIHSSRDQVEHVSADILDYPSSHFSDGESITSYGDPNEDVCPPGHYSSQADSCALSDPLLDGYPMGSSVSVYSVQSDADSHFWTQEGPPLLLNHSRATPSVKSFSPSISSSLVGKSIENDSCLGTKSIVTLAGTIRPCDASTVAPSTRAVFAPSIKKQKHPAHSNLVRIEGPSRAADGPTSTAAWSPREQQSTSVTFSTVREPERTESSVYADKLSIHTALSFGEKSMETFSIWSNEDAKSHH